MKLVIFGSGGHAGVVIDAIRAWKVHDIVGLLDDFLKPGEHRHGYYILGKIDEFEKFKATPFIAVGDNAGRKAVYERTKAPCPPVVHPSSTVAESCFVGNGVFIADGARISAHCIIDDYCIINSAASLGHDSTIGAFSHLAPGAITGGHVTIGQNTLIGIGAMIRDRTLVGRNCIIGMGSVVTKDVPDNSIGWGNPFRIHETRPV